MADLAKVQFKPGDKLRDLLDRAGVKPTEIPAHFERIAQANGTTVQALEILLPDRHLWVPSDIAAELPPDRLVAVTEDSVRASDVSAQRSAAIGRLGREALRKTFKGFELTEKVIGGGFEFALTSKDTAIIVELQTPRRYSAWTDPGAVTMTDGKSGLSATVELTANNVAKSMKDCKAKLKAVHKYARTLEAAALAKPAVHAAPAPPITKPAPSAAPQQALEKPAVPPPAQEKAPPTAPPPIVLRPVTPRKPARPLPPLVRMAAVGGITLVVGLALAWILFG